jgi:3-methylfumaryl-CoA hydratase
VPDDVLLFRYSALTFNSHRIHYDRRYVTEVEGYPGLVVHGPLLATLLVDLLRRQRPGVALRRFEFRALAPLFDIAPFDVCGRPEDERGAIALWAQAADGTLAMRATATPA